MSVDNIDIEIHDVMGNDEDVVSIPMTRLDDDGIYWSAEVDVAYMNASMQFHCEEIRTSTFLLKMPDKDGVEYNFITEWTIYGMDEDIKAQAYLDVISGNGQQGNGDGDNGNNNNSNGNNGNRDNDNSDNNKGDNDKVDSGNGNGNGGNDNNDANNSSGNNGGQQGSVDGGSVDSGDSVNAVIWIAVMLITVSVLFEAQAGRGDRRKTNN